MKNFYRFYKAQIIAIIASYSSIKVTLFHQEFSFLKILVNIFSNSNNNFLYACKPFIGSNLHKSGSKKKNAAIGGIMFCPNLDYSPLRCFISYNKSNYRTLFCLFSYILVIIHIFVIVKAVNITIILIITFCSL